LAGEAVLTPKQLLDRIGQVLDTSGMRLTLPALSVHVLGSWCEAIRRRSGKKSRSTDAGSIFSTRSRTAPAR
jgi:hypothetical protein